MISIKLLLSVIFYCFPQLTDAVQIADDAPLESVLRITGEVVLRPEGQRRKVKFHDERF